MLNRFLLKIFESAVLNPCFLLLTSKSTAQQLTPTPPHSSTPYWGTPPSSSSGNTIRATHANYTTIVQSWTVSSRNSSAPDNRSTTTTHQTNNPPCIQYPSPIQLTPNRKRPIDRYFGISPISIWTDAVSWRLCRECILGWWRAPQCRWGCRRRHRPNHGCRGCRGGWWLSRWRCSWARWKLRRAVWLPARKLL